TGDTEAGAPGTEVFWAIRRLLESASDRRPLLVTLEDLQWAEPTMLDPVEYIPAFGKGPTVLPAIARPEPLESGPSLAAVNLQLEQLSDADVDQLIEALG